MKPRWGTRALVGSQGSASMLGATLGFELEPLRGKACRGTHGNGMASDDLFRSFWEKTGAPKRLCRFPFFISGKDVAQTFMAFPDF